VREPANKPVVHRPYQYGWLSPRGCSWRMNEVVSWLEFIVWVMVKGYLLGASSANSRKVIIGLAKDYGLNKTGNHTTCGLAV
jgi:hypothetical protein